jgi:hypothetical protein
VLHAEFGGELWFEELIMPLVGDGGELAEVARQRLDQLGVRRCKRVNLDASTERGEELPGGISWRRRAAVRQINDLLVGANSKERGHSSEREERAGERGHRRITNAAARKDGVSIRELQVEREDQRRRQEQACQPTREQPPFGLAPRAGLRPQVIEDGASEHARLRHPSELVRQRATFIEDRARAQKPHREREREQQQRHRPGADARARFELEHAFAPPEDRQRDEQQRARDPGMSRECSHARLSSCIPSEANQSGRAVSPI